MSTDPSGAAIERVQAAAAGSDAPSAATPPGDLAELAVAIERVEALITGGATHESDRSAAVERIADIAFVLHEREVEASLCDALDAAVREISGAGAFKQASAQRSHQAKELLRELSRRINDMIALSQAEQAAAAKAAPVEGGAKQAAAGHSDNEADDELADQGLFETDLPEDDDFARVVAALAATVPEPSDPIPADSGMPREASEPVVPPPEDARFPDPLAQPAIVAMAAEGEAELPPAEATLEAALVTESSSAAFLGRALRYALNESTVDSLTGSIGERSFVTTLASVESSTALLSGEEPQTSEIRSEPAESAAAAALPIPATAGEGREAPISREAAPNEPSSVEPTVSVDAPSAEPPLGLPSPLQQQPQSEVSGNAERAALPEPDVILPAVSVPALPLGDDLAPTSKVVLEVAEAEAEPNRSPPSESAVFAPEDHAATAQGLTEPATSATVVTVQHDAEPDRAPRQDWDQDRDIEQQAMVDPVDAATRASIDEDELLAPADVVPSRALLPESQPGLGPDEDPGDLFEPLAEPAPASAGSLESAVPVVAAAPSPIPLPHPSPPSSPLSPPRSDVAANQEHTGAAAVETVPATQEVAAGTESESLASVSASETTAAARSVSAGPATTPQAESPQPSSPQSTLSAPPRIVAGAPARPVTPTANDPLAAVRALSEEEMIALFS